MPEHALGICQHRELVESAVAPVQAHSGHSWHCARLTIVQLKQTRTAPVVGSPTAEVIRPQLDVVQSG